ncbi:Sodium-coupled monocarboxylate transporter 1 [Araneus ventricosus]|uniref:Sodium-coupled monocarboxylate transporter 1 n=1 Tax=Araneus ventricosus TaxID=182803 RepID=A0A4Y2PZ83_ARAVE|nr:Sodium-coupled monocarboxylate transporter 1 [Araneus ventricosus]
MNEFKTRTDVAGAQFGTSLLLVTRYAKRRLSSETLYLGISLNIFFHALTLVAGLVIYAHFYKCDPLTAPNKSISAADQLLPYYVINTLGDFPGLPGLCICGVFGAALSTVSSAMNSLSAVTMQDLVRPFLESRRYSENTMAFAAKALTVFYGALCILLTVMAAFFGNLIQASIILWGMCGVPILAVFLLGMLTTRTNEKGALIGLVSSLCISAWVSFGAAAKRQRPKILPLSTEGCPANFSLTNVTSSSIFSTTVMSLLPETSTLSSTSVVPKINAETPYVFPLYKISYMWYGPLGLLVGLIVGYISSIIISRITGEYPDVPEEFVSPVLIQLLGKKKGSKEKESDILIAAFKSPRKGISYPENKKSKKSKNKSRIGNDSEANCGKKYGGRGEIDNPGRS